MADRCNYRRETAEVSYHSNQNPSFSSTLLDTIYRSIDQGEEEGVIYREAMRTKQKYCYATFTDGVFQSNEDMANLQRASMIEKWMEKKVSEKAVLRRQSAADLQTKKVRKEQESSSWSSSDSSSGGRFFSSEAELFPLQRPKPVRTVVQNVKNHYNSELNRQRRNYGCESESKTKREGGFANTKSRALNIYGELKKVKQPISPGGILAGILHNLFAVGKHKITVNGEDYPTLKSGHTSPCSSASSLSRSCLSKTPSSRGKPSAKRSVRFSPVSVIFNEDRPQKPLQSETLPKHPPNFDHNHDNPNTIRNIIQSELIIHVMEKTRRVESARDLNRNYHQKNLDQLGYEFEFSFDDLRTSCVANPAAIDHDFDCEVDDAASYASSDLFELDHLSAIGMESCIEELPVYETTHLRNNRVGPLQKDSSCQWRVKL